MDNTYKRVLPLQELNFLEQLIFFITGKKKPLQTKRGGNISLTKQDKQDSEVAKARKKVSTGFKCLIFNAYTL